MTHDQKKHQINSDVTCRLIVTRLQTGRSGVWIPALTTYFFISETSRPALGTTQTHVQWVPRLFPRGNAFEVWSWTLSSI